MKLTQYARKLGSGVRQMRKARRRKRDERSEGGSGEHESVRKAEAVDSAREKAGRSPSLTAMCPCSPFNVESYMPITEAPDEAFSARLGSGICRSTDEREWLPGDCEIRFVFRQKLRNGLRMQTVRNIPAWVACGSTGS